MSILTQMRTDTVYKWKILESRLQIIKALHKIIFGCLIHMNYNILFGLGLHPWVYVWRSNIWMSARPKNVRWGPQSPYELSSSSAPLSFPVSNKWLERLLQTRQIHQKLLHGLSYLNWWGAGEAEGSGVGGVGAYLPKQNLRDCSLWTLPSWLPVLAQPMTEDCSWKLWNAQLKKKNPRESIAL